MLSFPAICLLHTYEHKINCWRYLQLINGITWRLYNIKMEQRQIINVSLFVRFILEKWHGKIIKTIKRIVIRVREIKKEIGLLFYSNSEVNSITLLQQIRNAISFGFQTPFFLFSQRSCFAFATNWFEFMFFGLICIRSRINRQSCVNLTVAVCVFYCMRDMINWIACTLMGCGWGFSE